MEPKGAWSVTCCGANRLVRRTKKRTCEKSFHDLRLAQKR